MACYLFQVVFPLEWLISIVYYGFTEAKPDPREDILDFSAHTMPIVILLLEWSINSIEFEWKRSLWLFLYIGGAYWPM